MPPGRPISNNQRTKQYVCWAPYCSKKFHTIWDRTQHMTRREECQKYLCQPTTAESPSPINALPHDHPKSTYTLASAPVQHVAPSQFTTPINPITQQRKHKATGIQKSKKPAAKKARLQTASEEGPQHPMDVGDLTDDEALDELLQRANFVDNDRVVLSKSKASRSIQSHRRGTSTDRLPPIEVGE